MKQPSSGDRFGRLTFVASTSKLDGDKHLRGTWKCDCGNETEVAISRVKNGYTQSCGCLIADSARGRAKHGMRNSPEYSSWMAMKARCLDPDNKDYPRWGGRGIEIAPEWKESFLAFFQHVGPRPNGTSIDRIDTTKNYEPGNVRWANPTQQSANRRDNWLVVIDSVQFQTVAAAARHFDVSETTIVRWCEGFTDPRRNRHTPPRPNCERRRKYAY